MHVRGRELVSTATSDESEGWGRHESLKIVKWEVNKAAEGLVTMTHMCPRGVSIIFLPYFWFGYIEPFGIGIILSQNSPQNPDFKSQNSIVFCVFDQKFPKGLIKIVTFGAESAHSLKHVNNQDRFG